MAKCDWKLAKESDTIHMAETTETVTRDSRTLLSDMLEKIGEHKYNPIMSIRALRSVARGEVNTADFAEMRDITHAIYDWMCDFDKGTIDPKDQALLAIDIEAIEDRNEAVQVGRAQRKALRRVRKATASKQSKVDPTFVEAVAKRIENSYSNECAADILWYTSGLLVELKPAEVIEILEATVNVKVSYWNTGGMREWVNTIRHINETSIVKTVTSLWIGHYLWTHTWDARRLSYKHGLTNKTVAQMHTIGQRKQPIEDNQLQIAKLGLDQWKAMLGRPLTETALSDLILGKKSGAKRQMVAGAANISYMYKPAYDYAWTAERLNEMFEKARAKSGSLKIAELWDVIEKRENEFKIPERAVLENELIGGIEWTTIKDMAALKRNGTHMGNCTYGSYRSRYKTGRGVLFHGKDQRGDEWNVDLFQTGNGRWSIREIEKRYNRGPIPGVVRSAAQQLCDTLQQ